MGIHSHLDLDLANRCLGFKKKKSLRGQTVFLDDPNG